MIEVQKRVQCYAGAWLTWASACGLKPGECLLPVMSAMTRTRGFYRPRNTHRKTCGDKSSQTSVWCGEMMRRHVDRCLGRSARGNNLLNALQMTETCIANTLKFRFALMDRSGTSSEAVQQHRPALLDLPTTHRQQITELQQHRFGLGRA